jgi:hypothetical protein
MFVKQNIDAQLCTHVKNHHHHMNYIILRYSNFLNQICFKKMVFVKRRPKNVLESLLFWGTLIMNEPPSPYNVCLTCCEMVFHRF